MSRSIFQAIPVRHALLALTLVVHSACARHGAGAAPEEGANEPTTLEFQNESLAQADVFVSTSGSDVRRIGTVFAGRTETLTVPREIAMRGTITVVARLLARSRAPSSGTIAISPGVRLSIRLPLDERALYVLPAR